VARNEGEAEPEIARAREDSGNEIEIDGEEVLIVREDEVLAIMG
jgi:co-chaperonin GroES (HSP10)